MRVFLGHSVYVCVWRRIGRGSGWAGGLLIEMDRCAAGPGGEGASPRGGAGAELRGQKLALASAIEPEPMGIHSLASIATRSDKTAPNQPPRNSPPTDTNMVCLCLLPRLL